MEKSRSNRLDHRRILFTLLFWIGITLLMVVVLGGFQELFWGNQTTKMLYGLADAGYGYLDQDWMANTKDPLLAFSWIVKFTYQYLGVRFFHIYQFVLVGIYLYSLMMIADHFYQIRRAPILFFIFLSVYLLTYSDLWPYPMKILLHDGVAIQDLALTQFLPNGFAAFLFLSILLFLKERPYWAVISLVAACNVHTNYLIAGAALVSAYLVIDFWEKRDFKRVLMIGGLALLLVLPVVLYYLTSNQDAAATQVAEMNSIVVNLRIPHHTQVGEWWNGNAFLKTLLVMGALIITRRTRLFPILMIGLLVAAVPTVALFIRPSNKIAVLQIWRISVVLVPLSSAVLTGAMVSALFRAEEDLIRRWRWVIVLILSGLLVVVLIFGAQELVERNSLDPQLPSLALMAYVVENGGPGEVYLVPPKDRLLDPFRLKTGQPIYINWKSHPWYAVEFLEWYQRVERAESFYSASGEQRCALLSDFAENDGITHIVMPSPDELLCEGAEMIFGNEGYRLYQVGP
ncbi:MAG: hypothetical protein JW757_07655 [Anaerolineales bacterium]|nr:hypothetical protein [Anaerolineales bacterium]